MLWIGHPRFNLKSVCQKKKKPLMRECLISYGYKTSHVREKQHTCNPCHSQQAKKLRISGAMEDEVRVESATKVAGTVGKKINQKLGFNEYSL